MRFIILVGLLTFGFSSWSEESSWTEKLKVTGDVRLRHDMIQKDNASDRHRERFRARLGISAQVNEQMQAKFRLTSADGGDAISNNSTLTDNGSKKSAYIDLASIHWKVSEDLALDFGKMENGLRVVPASQLIFDADYTPEGVALDGNRGDIFAKLGAFSLAERGPQANGTSEPDSWLVSALVGWKHECACGKGWLLAAGYHAFTSLKDNAALFTSSGKTLFLNNSTYSTPDGLRYLHDYKVTEIVGEYHFKVQNRKISLFADAISNSEASEDNKGLLVGLGYSVLDEANKLKWGLTYNYRTVEKDATVAALNDSDFAESNNGSQGHTVVLSKAVMENAQVGLSYFVAQVGDSSNSYETRRGFLDFSVSF